MEITFVRTGGKHDKIYVHRTDGSETSWTFPSYGDEVPHDLIHLVVEAAFELKDGVYARVDRGVDMARVNELANRLGGANKYERQGMGGGDVLVSEALAAGASPFLEDSDVDRLRAMREGCEKYGVTAPATVTVERIREARTVLKAFRRRWAALDAKGSLRVEFDPSAPARSFEQMQR